MMPDQLGKEIVGMLHDSGMIKVFPKDNRDGWMLHSEIWSPFYIQMRPIFSTRNSKLFMDVIGDAMARLIEDAGEFSKLVGVASAGVPISVIASYKSGIPFCYTRRIGEFRTHTEFRCYLEEIDRCGDSGIGYGEHSFLEGHLEDGDDLVLIDDLITSGESKLIAKEIVEYEARKQGKEVRVGAVAVVIDREQGGTENLAKHGLCVRSLVPFKTKGIHWLEDKLDEREFALITDYLRDNTRYQDPADREEMLQAWG
ncbi:orotate phosphoribosyltransferase [Methanoculleus bourgensis]|jgi:orotate phosphoribosyltransferase|uniref:orotate phosphoribosyltransferase n=1 Tax=Methanoculleus bourgensis TaxID=83986 RepID=UPI003B9532BB